MNVGKVARSAAWVYLGSVISSVLGYVFWIIASGFAPPSAVGSASAILALQILLVTVASLGLSTGVKRFIGISQASGESRQISSYFSTTLLMTIAVNAPIICLLSFASLFSVGLFGLTPIEIGFVAILMIFGFCSPLFVSLFDSLLHTEVTALAQAVSSVMKILVGVILLLSGLDFMAIMIAFVTASLAYDFVLLFGTKKLGDKFSLKDAFVKEKSHELLLGSLPAWVPNMLTIAGQSMGVLLIYTAVGGIETGLYHIAFAIASIVYTLPTSILGLMFPVLSGMTEGRKEAASNAIRLSLSLTVPVCFILITYPFIPFMVLSSEYHAAFPLLAMLLVGAIFYPIYAGYYSFAYATKKYLHVLALGLAANGSRMILYVILVSTLGAMGIALSYALGIIVALVVVALSSRSIGFRLDWKAYAKPITVTGIIALLLVLFNVHFIIGIPILTLLSLLGYARLGVVTKSDFREILQAFLSDETMTTVRSSFKPISRLLFGE